MFGVTARYARSLRNRAVFNMVLVAAVSFPVAGWWVENPGSIYRGVVSLAAASVIVATVRDVSHSYRRALAGVMAEQRALGALRSSAAAAIVNGARPDRSAGDIDHVVLGPMAAVVETKSGEGDVTVQGDALRCNNRVLRGASLRKVRSQARALSHAVGVEVAPVVCVVGMRGEPFAAGGVTVCSASSLPEVVDALPEVISPEEALSVAKRLSEADSPQRTLLSRWRD